MKGELTACRAAASKAVDAANAFLAEVEKLAAAIERNEAYVLDLDAKADRRRVVEAEIEKLSAERDWVQSALDKAKESYAAFVASLPK